MQNIQQTTSFWNSYPGTLIEQARIGAAGGIWGVFLGSYAGLICDRSTSVLSDYFCMRPAKLFDDQKLKFYRNLMFGLKDRIVQIVHPFIPEVYSFQEMKSSELVTEAFAEELLCRFGIQKIALLTLAHFLPERIGRVLSRPTSRIIIASAIFAVVHRDENVLPKFINGMIYGALLEKYGLWACTISHITHNLFVILKREYGPRF